VWLLAAAFAVGVAIGCVGIGGILLIPALSALAGLTIHAAMATALFTFLFTGIAGTWAFQRRGTIDWRLARPVLAAAALCAFAGAWVNSLLDARLLGAILAAVIVFAGVYALLTRHDGRAPAFSDRAGAQRALLLGLGATSGFGSGLTGVGGPALSVPLMVLSGFPALTSIAVSQPLQIVAAAAGTLAHLRFGSIDFALAAPVTALEIAGALLGARLAHAIDVRVLRRIVAVLCLVVGGVLMTRALTG